MDGSSSAPSETRSSSPLSSSEASSGKHHKRTRASKPKVRTGCITWIRRVKCGEEKPACVRCVSTGRTCDGYDKELPPRTRTEESLRTAEMAKMEFIRTYQWNEALRGIRPIVADIDGTETEKRFFHQFRLAVADDGLAGSVWGFTTFWNRVAPQMSHHDRAVKHAVIALGSAYQLYQLQDLDTADTVDTADNNRSLRREAKTPDGGFTPESLEVFTIQQYNRSISELQRHVGSASPESIQVTLVCCLAFICLETLRRNHAGAVTHLVNGLNILESLPIEHFDFLADAVTDPDLAPPPPPPPNPISSNGSLAVVDMRDIIQLFGRLETSACFFASGFRPVVAARGYAHRKLDDGSDTLAAEFRTSRETHRAYAYFLRDALARLYEVSHTTASTDGDLTVGARQQECLRSRAARLDALATRFAAGPHAPAPDTPEHFCLRLDRLHFRCAQAIVASIDEGVEYRQGYGHGSGFDGYGYGYDGTVAGRTTSSASPSPMPSPSLSCYSSGSPPPAPTSYPTPSSSSLLLLLTPRPEHRHLAPPTSPTTDTYLTVPPVSTSTNTVALHTDLLAIATYLHDLLRLRAPRRDRIFFDDAGIVGPVYLVAVSSSLSSGGGGDPALRAQALRLLADMDGGDRGFFWDGPGLRERLGLAAAQGAVLGGVPLVQDALERVEAMRRL